jgi:hypothetical protein
MFVGLLLLATNGRRRKMAERGEENSEGVPLFFSCSREEKMEAWSVVFSLFWGEEPLREEANVGSKPGNKNGENPGGSAANSKDDRL